MRALQLQVLAGRYAVARLTAADPRPRWADGPGFTSVTRTTDELSVVCDEARVPGEVSCERGFRCLKVAGPLAFSEIGVLAALAQPLADAGISIFAVSTFDTDYLLVRGSDLPAAAIALRSAGHQISDEP